MSATVQRQIGDWVIGDTLGKGGYSWVKKGIHRRNRAIVALKFMSKADQSWVQEQTQQVATEIEALSQIDSPHVIKLYEYDVAARYPEKNGKDLDVILLVLEYAPGGELFDILYYTESLTEVVARSYFSQLMDGLEACHKAGVCHRDIKPQNLLLNNTFQLKITDFGLSKIFETDADTVMNTMYVGTRGYQAPELLIRKPYTIKADMFSAGVVLFILLSGYPPFEQASKKDKWYLPLISGNTRKFWRAHHGCGISPEAQDLLSGLLAYDPAKRLGMEEIRQHPWVRGKTLKPRELYQALRLQHRRAEIKRKQDAKKQSDLQRSVKRPIRINESDLLKQAPPLPADHVRSFTQFHTREHGYRVLNDLEEVMNSAKADFTYDKAEFKMEAMIVIQSRDSSRQEELRLEARVYWDEAAQMNLVSIKRMRGDFILYRKFYRRVWQQLATYVEIRPVGPEPAEEAPGAAPVAVGGAPL